MPPRTKQPSTDDAPPARRPERRRAPRKPSTVDVLAVLVAHDGAQWLPEALAALAASTKAPARVLCVDTGSTDGSAELMRAAFGDVIELPRTTGYGAAVAAALASLGPEEHVPAWLWLLHDDVAVEPTTLENLLQHAADSPSASLLGPKVRDWHDPRYLVEVGFTTDAAGHRETGLEHREQDQGQHDAVRDVLAVGTAAALVRREVWDHVGGLDPALTVFRDDLDLGWKVNAAGHRVVVVPEARVRHVRAATTGHRTSDAAPGRAASTDRRHALYVLLAHAGPLRLTSLVPRLLVATVLRSLVLLLTRQPAAAADEWRALLAVLGHPVRLHRARRSRGATRTLSQRRLRPLFASRAVRIRARLGALGDWLSGGSAAAAPFGGPLSEPTGDGTDAYDAYAPAGPGLLRTVLLRPGVLLFVGLSLVALVAERSVLALHGGSLYGGALLPPPGGARDLWTSYAASWHEVSVGTSASAPPSTAVLGLLSTLMLGKPWLAVDTLLLGSVPLAGLTAYLAASRLVRHLYLRLWAAATWALLPVATGAVAAGRLDAAALQVALPVLGLAAGKVLLDQPDEHGWWRVWALGLGLSVACAFAPLLWPLAAVPLLGAAVLLVSSSHRRRGAAAVLVALLPGALLFPWSLTALAHPSLLLTGQLPADADIPAWHLLVLAPGGPGAPRALLATGLLLGALGGLVRVSFRRLALAAWGVALVALAAAGLLARVRVSGHAVWPGVPLQVAGLAMVVAALVGAHGAQTRLATHAFGWRQVLSAAVAVLALLVPVASALAWVSRGADHPLRRGSTGVLPAFARAELAESPGVRALVLLPLADGRLAYTTTRGTAPTQDLAGLRPSSSQRAQLDVLVADLASPRGSDAAAALATRAVRYVALRPGPGAAEVTRALDAQPGLVRRSAGSLSLWLVVAPSNRLTLFEPDTAKDALAGAQAPERAGQSPGTVLPSGAVGARATIPGGAPGRLLVLADARDPGWRATLDGKRLQPRTAWGWAQAFVVPAEGGRLVVQHTHGSRRAALVGEGLAVLAVLVLALPAGRRRTGLEDDVDVEDDVDHSSRRSRAAL